MKRSSSRPCAALPSRIKAPAAGLWSGLLLIFPVHAADLTTATVDSGGGRSSGGPVVQDASVGYFAGISPAGVTTAKQGYIGQLYDLVGIAVAATPASVDEGGTRQLDASFILDDATSLALAEPEVAWSVVSGPVTGIDSGGLATGGIVYEDTPATVRGSHLAFEGDLDVTVRNVDCDNYLSYGGDAMADEWQVAFFGAPPNATADPFANPDGDQFSNFFEFASGTDPHSPDSGSLMADVPGGTFTPGAPAIHVAFSPLRVTYRFVRSVKHSVLGLTYTPEFSHDLSQFFASATTPTVLISDPGTGYELVAVPYPLFLPNGRKAQFSRLEINHD
ncbi:MAG: hypothetical protein HKN82_14530 [Akkermansiaceae bacterium]|nr:hypothetical protein [Akkermansiaceae bacterium]NNM30459.1 hypothetical protein [Akkermansiaceae bacterium]